MTYERSQQLPVITFFLHIHENRCTVNVNFYSFHLFREVLQDFAVSTCYRRDKIEVSGQNPTLQDKLRFSQGLCQPSFWYLPHPDLCIITSWYRQRYMSNQTSSCKCPHLHSMCIFLPTASLCVSKGSQEKSTTFTEFWMVGRDVSGSLPG